MRLALDAFTDADSAPTHTAVIAVAFQSRRATEAVRQFFDDRFSRASLIVQHAIERGELPDATDPVAVIRALLAPIYMRLFITREPVGASELEEAVDAAIAAAETGTFSTHKRGWK